MFAKENIRKILSSYGNPAIATICSHSALQIFAGAKQEGFRTIGICTKDRMETYRAFPHAAPDEFIIVEKFSDALKPEVQKELREKNAIIIPHGSFVEYLGPGRIEREFEVPIFGNRAVLGWESDREKSRLWLEKNAGLRMPAKVSPDKIDRLCIVKFDGAKGGRGYFFASDRNELDEGIRQRIESGMVSEEAAKTASLQEYVLGTRYYFHYFYTPLSGKGFPAGEGSVELLGIDRRDESNIDELHRLGMDGGELSKRKINLSYTVTGNQPAVIRESLLPAAFSDARKVVEASIKLFPPGIVGPFCLETVCTPNLEIVTFEVSARIVAGTNIYADGSQYSHLFFGKPVSMGQRIAQEIKIAIGKNMLEKVVY
ncbi:MAG: formate--phosphoribosylaminoimidazolecarboxamide ligase [Candidatus Aenigmatarchaeota archaeon]